MNSRIQRVIILCGVYRFALQMLMAIKQMRSQNNIKKECFLHLVLIHLNLNPSHRINFILEGVDKKNFLVFYKQLNVHSFHKFFAFLFCLDKKKYRGKEYDCGWVTFEWNASGKGFNIICFFLFFCKNLELK